MYFSFLSLSSSQTKLPCVLPNMLPNSCVCNFSHLLPWPQSPLHSFPLASRLLQGRSSCCPFFSLSPGLGISHIPPYHLPSLQLTQGFKNISSVIRCLSIMIYWVGQKVCLDFSIRCYGKTWINFLANPIYTTYKQGLCLLLLTNYIYVTNYLLIK